MSNTVCRLLSTRYVCRLRTGTGTFCVCHSPTRQECLRSTIVWRRAKAKKPGREGDVGFCGWVGVRMDKLVHFAQGYFNLIQWKCMNKNWKGVGQSSSSSGSEVRLIQTGASNRKNLALRYVHAVRLKFTGMHVVNTWVCIVTWRSISVTNSNLKPPEKLHTHTHTHIPPPPSLNYLFCRSR